MNENKQIPRQSSNGKAVSRIPSGHDATPNPEQDRMPHFINAHGDRMPQRYAYHTPTAGRLPAEKGKFHKVIEQIQDALPLTAAVLLHEYDDKLLPAYENVVATDSNAHDELNKMQDLSREREAEAEMVRIHEEESKRTELLEPLMQLKTIESSLHETALEAALKTAQCGGALDPENPTHEQALQVRRMTPAEAAAELCLPFRQKTKGLLAHVLTACGSVLVGLVIGLSMALAASALEIERIDAKAGVAIVASLVGVAAASAMRYAVLKSFLSAALSAYSQATLISRTRLYAIAFVILIACIAIDVTVERQGLLKLANISSVTAGLSSKYLPATPEIVFYLLGALLTVGYLCNSGLEGHSLGRQNAVENRALAHIETSYESSLKVRRNDSSVRDALQSISKLIEMRRRYRAKELEIAKLAAPYDERITYAEDRRIPYLTDFTEDQKRRMQIAIDQYVGTQDVLDYELCAARLSVEHQGFFKKLRMLFKRKPKVIGKTPMA